MGEESTQPANPAQRTYPTPVLDTARLRLRPMTLDDRADLFAIFSDPQAVRYWSSEPWQRQEQAEAAIIRALEGYRSATEVRLGVELRADRKLVGVVNLHQFFPQNRRCELGYAFNRQYWGMGLATEALTAALAHGFDALDLNRVEADIDPRNEASARLLERLGFRAEGYMPERWIVHGEAADTAFYGLLKRHWRQPG